jgi:ribosomal protein S21
LAHIIVDDNEMLEKAIKRFKRLVEKEGHCKKIDEKVTKRQKRLLAAITVK